MKLLKLYITVAILTAFVVACSGGLNEKQAVAVDAAIKSLGKLAAATDVGINYREYGPLLVDAKAQVNAANLVLPDSALKTELGSTLDAFVDAGIVWGVKIENKELDVSFDPGKKLIPKYSLKTKVSDIGYTEADSDDAIQAIWKVAESRYDKVIKLRTP